MTEKELRKLNRFQLLELLVMQTEQNEELQKQLEEIKNKKIEDSIQISKLGSVAEASVHISGILEAAQEAADIYMEEAKKRADIIVKEAYERAEAMLECAREGEKRLTIIKERYHIKCNE